MIIQISIRKSSGGDLSCIISSSFRKPGSATSAEASKLSHFGVLMNNLSMLEKTFADSDVLRLENDILSQLDRLGALKLFHTCLSRTRSRPGNSSVSEDIEEHQMESHVNADQMAKIVVSSGKKEKRKAKRVKSSWNEKDFYLLPSNSKPKHQHQNLSSPGKSSKYSGSRPKVARNEAELTVGVKVCSPLLQFYVLHDYFLGSYFLLVYINS